MPTKEKPKNVQIPLTIFKDIIAFMECCDTSGCELEFQQLYRRIFSALISKQESLELRDAYAKVVFAGDENQKKAALKEYLEQKALSED